MKIGEIFLGYTDGEEESKEEDFLSLYYDNNNIVQKILEPRIYYVLGRKGSGKTVTSYYINEKLNNDNEFCIRHSLGELTPDLFVDNNQVNNLLLFKLLFNIELARLILQNNSLSVLKEFNELKTLTEKFDNRGSGIVGNLKKLLDGVDVNFGLIKVSPSKFMPVNKESNLTNFNYDLEKLVGFLLEKDKETKYILLIDDIDNHITFYSNGEKILQDLIYSIQYLNNFTRRHNKYTKAILFIRTDIFFEIKDHNFNKLHDDHCFAINWYGLSYEDSDLFEIIAHKIKSRNKSLQNKQNIDIIKSFFVERVYYRDKGKTISIPTDRFILQRTFCRPRDLIRFIRFIQEKYPHLPNIDSYTLTSILGVYAYWLKNEIESELHIHYPKDYIKKLFEILSKPNSPIFGFNRLVKLYENGDTKVEDLEISMKILYKFNAVGQIWTDFEGEKHIRFNYTNYNTNEVNDPNFFINNFIIHFGIREAILKYDFFKSEQQNNRKT